MIVADMAAFITSVIDIVGALFLIVLAFILVHKVVGEFRAGYERRHKALYLPRIQAYMEADTGAFHDFIPGPIRGWDRRVVLWILFDRIRLVKGRAQERLSQAFESLGYVEVELAKLRERRWSRRVEGAEHLGWMMSRRAVVPLVALMQDPVPEVRIRAAKALGTIGGLDAVESLLGALRDTNRWSALRIADILSGLGQAAVEPLIREFPHLPPSARVPAIDILGRLRSPLAVPLLRTLLRDPEPNARARAAHSLGMIGDPRSADDLVTALQDDAWPVRAMAAKALGLLSGTAGIAALQRALGDREWWVRSNAAEALRAKGPLGHRALISMLDGADAYAAQRAASMLQEAGVFDAYLARLVGGTPEERAEAQAMFGKLVALRRLDLLNDIAARHGDPAVRAEVSRLLAAAQPEVAS